MPTLSASRSRWLAVLTLALAAGAAWLFNRPEAPAAEQTHSAASPKGAATSARPALVVTAEPPQRLPLAERLAANGDIAPWQEATIGADVNGLRLAQVRADVGDRVQKGQVLAVFDADLVEAD
ncbi:MAG: biotin/lipoyl-binding protein, partial [Candidatus Contendobacter sp.]